ncbi:hypothetical protein [Priestia taiwanensis]|nr:hypothetical protein [Priestia taiwanensis]MBM7361941.1 hypothetical protein [Priestia taiwanensis]
MMKLKKRMLVPIMSMGVLFSSAFYHPIQQEISAETAVQVSTNEFWLSDGNPIKYHPYFNSFIGIADFSSTPEHSSGQIIFEFYDLKGDLVYSTSATVSNASTYQPFLAPIKGVEEGSYSVKVKSIDVKVDPASVKISHVN